MLMYVCQLTVVELVCVSRTTLLCFMCKCGVFVYWLYKLANHVCAASLQATKVVCASVLVYQTLALSHLHSLHK